jgi:2-polyprenyl-3-methyl-5-hydroxy-6-metoxy-1,4-benzoquinol methylase
METSTKLTSTKNVLCPLTHKNNVTLQKVISVGALSREYKKQFDIDVSYLFNEIDSIRLYRCNDTGYLFYYPFHISGDDEFYNHFGKYNWYYLPWKREHEESLEYISENAKVLEVGAAKGDFLKRVKHLKNADCVGLELNSEAVREGTGDGIRLINQSIEEHAVRNNNKYDVVCSFQVLEHISNVGEVIKSMIDCLRPGGNLIISVPNNESFIKDNPLPSKILNMPPHHMGLWSNESLSKLCTIFPLECVEIKMEPLQLAQMDTYQYTLVKRILFNSSLLVKVYWKIRFHLILRPLIKALASRIMGHSIMCVYTKVK